jgi:hypothetical protein
MNLVTHPNRTVLEESPEYFWERFSQYAQTWPVSPEPLGSPLLEVLTPVGPLFAFDRTLVPFAGSETPLLFHGQVAHWESAQNNPPAQHLGGGRYQMTGLVEAVLDELFFVFRVEGLGSEAGLRLVLSAQNPPSVGGWATVYLMSPLMVFRPDSYSR